MQSLNNFNGYLNNFNPQLLQPPDVGMTADNQTGTPDYKLARVSLGAALCTGEFVLALCTHNLQETVHV